MIDERTNDFLGAWTWIAEASERRCDPLALVRLAGVPGAPASPSDRLTVRPTVFRSDRGDGLRMSVRHPSKC
jgi:hypothetical protein